MLNFIYKIVSKRRVMNIMRQNEYIIDTDQTQSLRLDFTHTQRKKEKVLKFYKKKKYFFLKKRSRKKGRCIQWDERKVKRMGPTNRWC